MHLYFLFFQDELYIGRLAYCFLLGVEENSHQIVEYQNHTGYTGRVVEYQNHKGYAGRVVEYQNQTGCTGRVVEYQNHTGCTGIVVEYIESIDR